MTSADHAARVRRAARAKQRADEAYRRAVLEAVQELQTMGRRDAYAQVAKAAGVTRQTILKMVARAS